MLLNKQAVRQLVRERKKQMSGDFIEALDRKVYEMIVRVCDLPGVPTRLSGSTLILSEYGQKKI